MTKSSPRPSGLRRETCYLLSSRTSSPSPAAPQHYRQSENKSPGTCKSASRFVTVKGSSQRRKNSSRGVKKTQRPSEFEPVAYYVLPRCSLLVQWSVANAEAVRPVEGGADLFDVAFHGSEAAVNGEDDTKA